MDCCACESLSESSESFPDSKPNEYVRIDIRDDVLKHFRPSDALQKPTLQNRQVRYASLHRVSEFTTIRCFRGKQR